MPMTDDYRKGYWAALDTVIGLFQSMDVEAVEGVKEYKSIMFQAIMGLRPSRESKMASVTLADGTVGSCDPEIQTLVQALNDGGFKTIASCSGHNVRPATIALEDGREILVLRNYGEARSLDKLWPNINNGL